MIAVLLVLAGVASFSLPHMSTRRTRRLYQPWLESGLLPVLIGGVVHLAWAPLLTDLSNPIWDDLRAILTLALTAAGMLVGMQFRAAYLTSAGPEFLKEQSVKAVGQFVIAAYGVSVFIMVPISLVGDIIIASVIGGMAVATSQRVPLTASLAGFVK